MPRYAGYATWSYPDKGPVERDTLMCCHCGIHWFVQPDNNNLGGWCRMCAKPICGAPKCDSCIPFEKKLETMERNARFTKAAGLQER